VALVVWFVDFVIRTKLEISYLRRIGVPSVQQAGNAAREKTRKED
jgi:hypothetical protein